MSTQPPAESAGRVLVVDDRMENRELLEQELEDEDFEVRTAASGQECLDIARDWLPEVILLDINMPGMDGIEACRRLKSSAETATASVLFVTALRTDDRTTVEALAAGGNDFLTKPYSLPILLARVNCQLEIARAHSRLRRMAMTDELTGVFTRRFLFDSLRKVVKGASRHTSTGLACLLADVDHFKRINDQLGHIEGDRVLRNVAQTIRRSIRETDVVARFGGEEFVVVLPHTDPAGATVVAEKVRGAIEADCAPVTISIGVAYADAGAVADAYRSAGVDHLIEHLLRRADTAMYAAKHAGRNRVVMASPDDSDANESAGASPVGAE
jgi:diguanylate cyclase (GGDEF)-like protein